MAELEDSLAPTPVHSGASETDYPIFVVVGTGPVGVRCAQKLLELNQDAQVVIFGAEAESPYNRVKLSQYLSEQLSLSDIDNPIIGERNGRLAEFIDRPILAIDRANKTVTDATGKIQPYSKLVLATGSNPTIPRIPGVELENVHPFRSLRNTENLIRLREQNRHICVVGAGALGLEAAAALKTQKNRVTLQSRTRLLSGMLNEEAEDYLKSALGALGIELKIGDALTAIKGDDSVRQLQFASGETLETDAVVLCTGIHPETDLARQCGLKTDRGIVVSEWLQTSDPDIYAVGECAEFAQKVYQFVRPGYEQVESCSKHICREGNPDLSAEPYRGSLTDIQLKIAHIPCALIGELDRGKNSSGYADTSATDGSRLFTYRNRFKGLYRQLLVKDNYIVGAVHIGSWDEASDLRKAVARSESIAPQALQQFERDGYLWQKKSPSVLRNSRTATWSASATMSARVNSAQPFPRASAS
ncbi:NAD(P)/FAD-dependent oxidoreductase [Microbulbifer taiwanensis]|uniref:NAD(P)/FAD-dependent oxidoreductase n=1 Tax=Microbulbifer taiwanensis TaxID=986746 RepID=UPI00360D8460